MSLEMPFVNRGPFFQASLLSSTHVYVSISTMRPRRNIRHFADDIFKCFFPNEIVWISIEISLTFIPKGQINNIPVLVQIMVWYRPGDKPSSEWWSDHKRIYASLGFNESMNQIQRGVNVVWRFLLDSWIGGGTIEFPPTMLTKTFLHRCCFLIKHTGMPVSRICKCHYWHTITWVVHPVCFLYYISMYPPSSFIAYRRMFRYCWRSQPCSYRVY